MGLELIIVYLYIEKKNGIFKTTGIINVIIGTQALTCVGHPSRQVGPSCGEGGG